MSCEQEKNDDIVFYQTQLSCGLFGLADDSQKEFLSLDDKLIPHKEATFLVRCSGQSMAPFIMEGDILVVDRSLNLKHGDLAAFYFNDQAICKRYERRSDGQYLVSDNPDHPPMKVTSADRLELFGVVRSIIRELRS